ncbi:MAG: FHA domain-containing protein, partial [Nannocystaceae bacterium]|nr:FHA domain-containing protein [Nannocystaceae bacterium]
MFEHAGEHAQAALLRIEHARTLRDPAERLDVLREGCARNPGNTPQSRTLHLALAEMLLDARDAETDASRIRSLELEAARALEEAGQFARAGETYEALGLLRRAARAYESGGEIARLELVLEVLERLDDIRKRERDLLREFDEALAAGQRRFARELLAEHDAPPLPVLASEAHRVAAPGLPSSLIERRRWLQRRLIDRDRVDLAWSGDRLTAVRMSRHLEIGRSPSADITLPGPRLSREHVRLSLEPLLGRTRLAATDLGSKVGTFWDGQALMPGEATPLEGPGVLALGMTAELEVVPVEGNAGAIHGALVRASPGAAWILFLPNGGPVWLAPDIKVPARVLFDRGLVTFDLAAGVGATLGGRPLGAGANIEFMLGDRLCLVGAPLCLEVLA